MKYDIDFELRKDEHLRAHRMNEYRRELTVERITGVPASWKERSAYGPDSEFSWFADLLSCARDAVGFSPGHHAMREARGLPHPSASSPLSDPPGLSMLTRGGAEIARKRLATVEREERAGDLTSTMPFMASPVPGFIESAYSVAVRAAAVVTPLFGEPERLSNYATDGGTGKTITVPRINTGATVAVQATENSAVSNTDQVSAAVTSLITTIAGYTVLTQQLLDLGVGGRMDQIIAAELGDAFGNKLDSELISGTNSSGRTTGLVNVAGATASTYTQSTPTHAALLQALASLWSSFIAARGQQPTHVIVSPKTAVLLFGLEANETSPPSGALFQVDPNNPRLPFGPRVVVSDNLPTQTLLMVYAPDLLLCFDGARFNISDQAASTNATTLQAVATTYGFAAAGYRRPEGVGVMTGTGLA